MRASVDFIVDLYKTEEMHARNPSERNGCGGRKAAETEHHGETGENIWENGGSLQGSWSRREETPLIGEVAITEETSGAEANDPQVHR